MRGKRVSRRDFFGSAAIAGAIVGAHVPVLAQTQAAGAETVTLLFSLTTKEGREQEFATLAATLTQTSTKDDGCLAYIFLQQQNNAREFVLYEQWRDAAALKAHIGRLQKVYGPPRPEGGGIPAAILDLADQSRAVRYRVVA